MSTLYVTEQGAHIRRRGGKLLVYKSSEVLQAVPETQISQIVLMGSITPTTPVTAFCLGNNIDLVYLSPAGQFRGRLYGDLHKLATLRQEQYTKARDQVFRIKQARQIVFGKLSNLAYFARRQERGESAEINRLRGLANKALTAQSAETLLGLEGTASATYFKLLGKWMPAGWKFERRSSNPPKDAVNAMMSLSYILLYNRIMGLLNVVGLDPYQGCFHQFKYGHAALASDLMEEFRPIFCDALVLRLLKLKQIKPADIPAKNGQFRLSKEAFKIFVTEFETKLMSRRKSQRTPEQTLSYFQIIEQQVRHFARVIKGEDEIYKPFVLR